MRAKIKERRKRIVSLSEKRLIPKEPIEWNIRSLLLLLNLESVWLSGTKVANMFTLLCLNEFSLSLWLINIFCAFTPFSRINSFFCIFFSSHLSHMAFEWIFCFFHLDSFFCSFFLPLINCSLLSKTLLSFSQQFSEDKNSMSNKAFIIRTRKISFNDVQPIQICWMRKTTRANCLK